jgi:hypothetical protein
MAKKNNIKKEEISETQLEAPKEIIEEVEEVESETSRGRSAYIFDRDLGRK